jgi:hypothetical protein
MSEHTIHVAEERLLDAALEQLLGPARTARTAARQPWYPLAAALFLLGVVVTAASLWLAQRGPTVAQEPKLAPLPLRVRADGVTALEALPADTANLGASLLDPQHVGVLERFAGLRRLELTPLEIWMFGVRTGRYDAGWRAPTAETLAPLADLKHLESLLLGSRIGASPALLAPLARSGSLHELELQGESVVLDEPFVEALAAIHGLTSLRLDLVAIDAAAAARLARLPIAALHVSRPRAFDGDAWQALCAAPKLESLSLGELGRADLLAQRAGAVHWRPEAADLAALPRLRCLSFDGCDLRDDELDALPDSLEELRIQGHELSADGLRKLQRLGALRKLDVNTMRRPPGVFYNATREERVATADAVAAAIGKLRLQELTYFGELTPAMAAAVAEQVDLTSLSLSCPNIESVEPFVPLRKLQRLRLGDWQRPSRITVELLQPLRACRSLRELELVDTSLDVAAVRAAVGDAVVVRQVQW